MAIVLLLSFKADEPERGSFYATVDGKPFRLREDQVFKGIVSDKSGSMDGRIGASTVMMISFYGSVADKADNLPFSENIQFEINYEQEKTGEANPFAAALLYQTNQYTAITEKSKIKITEFTWEPDHKHFLVSADFDCKMLNSGFLKEVTMKGKMSNIRVTVPSWIAARSIPK